MKKRIIFDVDGTLIPNLDFSLAVRMAFDDLGIEYTEDDVLNFTNAMLTYEQKYGLYNYEYYLQHIRDVIGKDLEKKVLDNYFKHTERLVPKRSDLIVTDTLEYLLSKEYELGVLSNFFTKVQENRLGKLGYLRYFSFILGGEEFVKPSREAYYEAAREMRQDNVVFVGASRNFDYEIPKRMGFDAVLYDPKCQYSTKTLVNNFSELRKVL